MDRTLGGVLAVGTRHVQRLGRNLSIADDVTEAEMNVSEGLGRDSMGMTYKPGSWRFSRDASALGAAGAAETRAMRPARTAADLMMATVLEDMDLFDGCVDEDGSGGYGCWMEDGME
jgi:hypothetical protein